jgi:hypothetical protein
MDLYKGWPVHVLIVLYVESKRLNYLRQLDSSDRKTTAIQHRQYNVDVQLSQM